MKTVFIVGAGASKEVKLPVGSELKKSIAQALSMEFDHFDPLPIRGDRKIAEAFYAAVRTVDPRSNNIKPFTEAAWHIREAMPQSTSIDNFIDSQGGDKYIQLCGKLAIVQTILQEEGKSDLFINDTKPDHRIDFERLGNTWFRHFENLLTDSCKVNDLRNRLRSIVFIIFNYDRCIEHYLYHAIQNYYRLTVSDTVQSLRNLEICHPYGSAGSLPWQGRDNATPFGAQPNARQLLQLASEIKTFSEGTDESLSYVEAIRSHMETANNLVFLGFAFHRLNMSLLLPQMDNPSKDLSARRHIYATAHGISNSNVDVITEGRSDLFLSQSMLWMAEHQWEARHGSTDLRRCQL
jgi:hypothetical protein